MIIKKVGFRKWYGSPIVPDPRLLVEGGVCAPLHMPLTTYEHVTAYLANHDAGKAYKGGKGSLMKGDGHSFTATASNISFTSFWIRRTRFVCLIAFGGWSATRFWLIFVTPNQNRVDTHIL